MSREFLPRIAATWSYRSLFRNHRIPERKVVKTIVDKDPERKEAIIANGKARMAELANRYPGILLDRQSLQADLAVLQPEIFANVKKAVKPAHEMRHMAAVRLLAEVGLNIVETQQAHLPEEQKVLINRTALLKSAMVHDVPRYIWDWVGSVHGLNRLHGRVAAEMFPKWFKDLDSQTIDVAQEALRYHDRHHTPQEINNPALELLVIADRLELSRMLLNPFYGNKLNPLRRKFEKRRKDYNARYFSGLSEQLIPVADAFYLMGVAEINKRVAEAKKQGRKMDPSEQVDAVLATAQELGMLKPSVGQPIPGAEASAQSVPVAVETRSSRRTSPTA